MIEIDCESLLLMQVLTYVCFIITWAGVCVSGLWWRYRQSSGWEQPTDFDLQPNSHTQSWSAV